MWPGRMTKTARPTVVALALLPWLALAAQAQELTPMDCATLTAAIAPALAPGGAGYALSVPASLPVDGWCVLDGASLRAKAADQPNITVERLRLRGDTAAGVFHALEVQATGLRVTPKLNDRKMDARLVSFLRLTVADVLFVLRWNAEAGLLDLRDARLVVGERLALTLGAEIAVADPAAGMAGLIGAALRSVDLRLVSDGSMARPLLEAAGERLLPDGAGRGQAVTAAKAALGDLVATLPDAAFPAGKAGLDALVAALPQTPGAVQLTLRSEAGIGAARLAIAAWQDDPLSAKALDALLQGVALTVDWTPGLRP